MMWRIKQQIINFMYGRYGIDKLYYVLFVLFVVLMMVNAFVNSFVISLLMWVVLVYMFFRVLSRNTFKRQMENDKILKILNKFTSFYKLTIKRIKEFKTYRYRKCPYCKAMLHLPRKTGKHTVCCPKCKNDFKVRIWF
ncbi:MAG: hypothetical protein PHV07_05995 [Oscillospiraceae bacterium]|nr:hypothetical protein [Oscillospiraceae bacterium]